MNQKIVVRSNDGKVRYCVLSGERDLQEQFNEWYFGEPHPGHGLAVDFSSHTFKITDYFHAETRATFDVLSVEDTKEAIVLAWTDPETGKTGWN